MADDELSSDTPLAHNKTVSISPDDLTTEHTIEFVEDNDPNDLPFCFQAFLEHQDPVPLRGLVNWDIGVTTYEPLALDLKGPPSSHKDSTTETKSSTRWMDPIHWRGITDNSILPNSRNISWKDKVTSRDSTIRKTIKPQATLTSKDGETMTFSNIKINAILSPQYTRLIKQGSHVDTWYLMPPLLWKGEISDLEPSPPTKGRLWYATSIPGPPVIWPADTPEPEPPPEPPPSPMGSSKIMTDPTLLSGQRHILLGITAFCVILRPLLCNSTDDMMSSYTLPITTLGLYYIYIMWYNIAPTLHENSCNTQSTIPRNGKRRDALNCRRVHNEYVSNLPESTVMDTQAPMSVLRAKTRDAARLRAELWAVENSIADGEAIAYSTPRRRKMGWETPHSAQAQNWSIMSSSQVQLEKKRAFIERVQIKHGWKVAICRSHVTIEKSIRSVFPIVIEVTKQNRSRIVDLFDLSVVLTTL
jgi:hypothetical protein